MAEALNLDSATEALKSLRQNQQIPDQPIEEPTEFGENLKTEIAEQETDVSETQEVEQVSEETAEEVGAETEAETYDLGADDLASLLGIKEDQIQVNDEGKISFVSKTGDEISDVNLESLINAYQGDANLTNRSKKIAEQERQIQSKLAEYNQQTQDFASQAAKILEKAKEFANPYSREDLKSLREDDPAEYAARMEEVRQREAQFNAIVNEAVNLTNSSQETITEDMKLQYNQYLEGERQKIRNAVPDWEKVEQDVVNYALESGYSNQEISLIADSRIQSLLYKAMMFDKGKESVKKKLTKKIPKITKPGKVPSKTQVSLDQVQKAKSRLKESGNVNDAVNLLKLRRK